MGNVLRMEKRQQIQALTALDWSVRRISRETGIARRTVMRYRREGEPASPEEPEGARQSVPKVPADFPSSAGQNAP